MERLYFVANLRVCFIDHRQSLEIRKFRASGFLADSTEGGMPKGLATSSKDPWGR